MGGAAGNDITLTLVSGLAVTTTADTGAGSLRNAIANAAAHAGADAVTFDASLNGQTITLTGPANGYAITIADSSGVTLDASNLTGGLTIQGGGTSGNFGLLQVNSGSSLTLRGITLANAGGNNASGGAMNNLGTATLSQCTLASNTGYGGGAISNSGALTLVQCTISGNASVEGGAVFNQAGTVTVSQCTLGNNSATLVGGAIYENGTGCTIANSIVAENSGSLGGADIYNNNNTITISGANVVQTFGGSGTPTGSGTIINAAPVLAPLGSYGGPTQTMPSPPGSPARNAAVGSAFTTDQRGFAITDGSPDLGAYEAGNVTNYNAWIYENLPANTASNAAQHAATFDYDGDGVSNYNEWFALTNPGDPASYLRATLGGVSGTTANISFLASSGVTIPSKIPAT